MKKKTLSLALALALCLGLAIPAVAAEATQFEDVPQNAWYAEAVSYAVANYLTSGYDATHYGPDDTVSREQVAQFAYNLASEELRATRRKTDSQWWAHDVVVWAAENGILKNIPAEPVEADLAIPASREEAVAAMVEVCVLKREVSALDGMNYYIVNFPDMEQISADYLRQIKTAYNYGIIQGKNGGYFDPQANLTRAEMAQLLLRFHQFTQSVTAKRAQKEADRLAAEKYNNLPRNSVNDPVSKRMHKDAVSWDSTFAGDPDYHGDIPGFDFSLGKYEKQVEGAGAKCIGEMGNITTDDPFFSPYNPY